MGKRREDLVFRIVSYNIHGCVDANRQVDPLTIHRILQQLDADIIALQEVDGATTLYPGRHQADIIGKRLKQNYVYFPTDDEGLRAFGLAVISRFKIRDAHFDWLPNLHPRLNMRKRAALRVTLDTPAGNLHVVNTHLSIYKLESYKQAKALLAGSWLDEISADEPVILCGDFNAGPTSTTYRMISRSFTDVQKALNNGRRPKPTFHARSTHWRIDHIFVSPHFKPIEVEVPRSQDTQTASDHLPLSAEMALSGSQAFTRGALVSPLSRKIN